MPRFMYKARNDAGRLLTGEMEAETKNAVMVRLDGMGLLPTSVTMIKDDSKGFMRFFKARERIKPDDLIFFTRELQTIVRAGIPLIAGLKALEEQNEDPVLRHIIRDVSDNISKGKTFSEALAVHKGVFTELYISMVRAGELGGILDDILGRLITLLEFQMKTREMIKAAMRYPVMVVGTLIVAFIVIVTLVIPKFSVIFTNAKIELPLPTRLMLGINDAVQNYGILILIVLGLSVAGIVSYVRSPKGRRNWDMMKLRIPLVGQILLKITMSRFANMFENMIRAGIPIIRALEIVSRTVGNEYVAEKIIEIDSKVEKGRGISQPLKDSGIFPPLVIHLVSTGEETGSLEKMLREVTIHYDREITYSIGRLSAWIEPVLTAGLSAMVLFLALAVFMPWWNMMGAMKGGQ